uniref:Tetratricopeptide repeat protein n=1 Tax=Promethearchaeum syntrophicum TaxID=2594042 RepID=A0A5B9DFE7_9ARCH|nr:hypothetical protein [Candidatus Prometheoarchaeum syntrophicum]QEE17775.1 hypothetical protein DSAG12_03613 [Candidatus Prometheoarchaeum syntrophicum]
MINTYPIEKISKIRMSSLEIFHSQTESERWDRHIHAMMETVKRTENPYVLAFTLKFAARFYFKQHQFETAIKLVKKVLLIYPANHRLRKSTMYDLYRYQMVDAREKGDDLTAEALRSKLKEMEEELRDKSGFISE